MVRVPEPARPLACGLFFLLAGICEAWAGTYYLSPAGSDAAAGTAPASAWQTFAKAFAAMGAGDELILLDGVYADATTGHISWQGARSGQPPSGSSLATPTRVRALNPGKVTIQGEADPGLFIGRSARKDRYIRIEGITFKGGGQLYNTQYVTLKDCGFHGGLTIGTNDHDQGNTDNLVEDAWVWGSGLRIIAANYRADRNVWRRVVVRGDGCGLAECAGSGNPNVGITVYESRQVSLQNVLVVDRILATAGVSGWSYTDSPYADFASAQHTSGYPFGDNEWLGTLSLNSPDSGYYLEADAAGSPAVRLDNAVVWNAADWGMNVAVPATVRLAHLTSQVQSGDGVRLMSPGTLDSVIALGSGRFGINSVNAPAHANVSGAWDSAYNQTSCTAGCYASDPRSDGTTPSLRYPVRIEPGSLLSGKGAAGTDIGANVVQRYGAEGSRYGDAAYNTVSAAPLWPWPNEGRIKQEMCADSGVSRGFCAGGSALHGGAVTLSSHVWEAAGAPCPAGICGSAGPYPIATAALPAAGGTVSCTPNPVAHGEQAACTFRIAPGYTFGHWGGDCAGSSCTLDNVGSARSVTANFLPANASTTVPTLTRGTVAGIAVTGCTAITSAGFAAAPAGRPAGTRFPFGVLDLALAQCSNGATVTLTYPTVSTAASHYTLAGSGWLAYPAILAPNSVTFAIADNGSADNDGQPGTIRFTSALALPGRRAGLVPLLHLLERDP
jgi:hypothetical protein